MAFDYTAEDLDKWLRGHATHGARYAFALDRMKKLGHTLTVEDLWMVKRGNPMVGRAGKPFVCSTDFGKVAVRVDQAARDQQQATDWAMDALREWAGAGAKQGGNYFGKMARAYAKEGPGKGNTAKSIGMTLDWLFLFTSHLSASKSSTMFKASGGTDLPNVLCWAYADIWGNEAGAVVDMAVDIAGSNGKGPPGLHEKFWDSDVISGDQTHHFAFYFNFGATVGAGEWRLHAALSLTGDWSITDQKVTNQGDYDLGFMAARWGKAFDDKPDFIGKRVEDDLLNGRI